MSKSKKKQVNPYYPPRNWTNDWLEEHAKRAGTKLTPERAVLFKEEVVKIFKATPLNKTKEN